ncbi:MAG TPA: hypothetical protein VGC45_04595 [Gryllotalpicola sp.]
MTLRQDQQPLTRRQLREMERAAQAAKSDEQQVPAVELPFSAQSPAVPAELKPVRAAEAAEAEDTASAIPADSVTDADPETPQARAPQAEPAQSEAAAPAAPVVPLTRRQLRALQQAQEHRSASGPAADESAPVADPLDAAKPALIAEVPITALPLPQASIATPPVISAAPAPAAVDASVAEPEVIDSAPAEPVTGEVRAYQPPTGHWSLGANESFDDVIASGVEEAQLRSVESSGGSSASNALIVPIVPSAADMTGPLNATGEILLTGSIDLPRGLGSTGQIQGHFDGSDIDHLLDQHDRDATSNSSVEPVAATRAIATHAPSASPNIVPPKQAGHRIGAIVGSVAGGVAALAVAGVLVAGFVFHAF